jgi:hypothetical protein
VLPPGQIANRRTAYLTPVPEKNVCKRHYFPKWEGVKPISASGRSVLFLKKRTKKLLLICYVDFTRTGAPLCTAPNSKSFWFFFSKKNPSSLAGRHRSVVRSEVDEVTFNPDLKDRQRPGDAHDRPYPHNPRLWTGPISPAREQSACRKATKWHRAGDLEATRGWAGGRRTSVMPGRNQSYFLKKRTKKLLLLRCANGAVPNGQKFCFF